MVGFLQRKDCMKFRLCRQFIFYLFIAILFTSGMQVNKNDLHSFFVCESKASTENPQYLNSQVIIFSDYCSNELLQPRNTQYLRNNSKKNSTIPRTRVFSPIAALLTTSQNLFYFEEQHISKMRCTTYSQVAIIEYIHRQDGAK